MLDFSWVHNPHSEWWNVANVVGTWLAAVGSIATAVVALILANRDRRIRLQLIATIGNRYEGVTEGDVLLSVSNLGHRSVVVTWVGFTTGFFPQWSPVLPTHNVALNVTNKPPTRPLDDGESYRATERFHPLVVNLADALPAPLWLGAWSLRFWAHTSVDVTRSVRVSKELRRRVLKMARRPRD